MAVTKRPFRPRARLMHLLGDQLIRDAGIAVFELVKNAYDADASKCTITVFDVTSPEKASIVVEDDGIGMDLNTISEIWLVLGTEHKKAQKQRGERTAKGRLPLGEKGIGRFAVHKLGDRIRLVTRARGQQEIVVDLDWKSAFSGPEFLGDVKIPIVERKPEHFSGRRTGTRIEVTNLRDTWTRGKMRDLHRAISSICSPFLRRDEVSDSFEASLVLKPDPEDWLRGLFDVKDVIELAIFHGHGIMDGDQIRYEYEFTPPSSMKRIKGRSYEGVERLNGILPEDEDRAAPGRRPMSRRLSLDEEGIGAVGFSFHIFDREPTVLSYTTHDSGGLKRYLDANGGIRVYRDGMRVYDFGESGNDWLNLGGRRVNIPVRRISNNQVIGAVMLDGETSADALVEKTNREGFIANKAYQVLRAAVLKSLELVEIERYKDRERIRKLYSSGRVKQPVIEDLAELRAVLKKKKLLEELGPIVDRVEQQFVEVRDRLITAAGAGLSLTVVLHEVEKIVAETVKAVERRADRATVAKLVHHISEIVDGLAFLVRSSGRTKEKASTLVQQALFNFDYRFQAHRIHVMNGFEKGDKDFTIRCMRRLIVSTLTNFLDNSIYWLEPKGADNRQIYVGTRILAEGPSFIVADNGPGFNPQDAPEYLTQPFFSRKEDGMGLGLHIANEVAQIHKGQLLFPEAGDIGIPPRFNGAVVALQIPIADAKASN